MVKLIMINAVVESKQSSLLRSMSVMSYRIGFNITATMSILWSYRYAESWNLCYSEWYYALLVLLCFIMLFSVIAMNAIMLLWNVKILLKFIMINFVVVSRTVQLTTINNCKIVYRFGFNITATMSVLWFYRYAESCTFCYAEWYYGYCHYDECNLAIMNVIMLSVVASKNGLAYCDQRV